MDKVFAHWTLIALVGLLPFLSGCKPPAQESSPSQQPPLLSERFGKLAQVPANADFFLGVYDAAGAAGKVVNSRLVNEVLANNLIASQLIEAKLPTDAPVLLAAVRSQSPDFDQVIQIIEALCGREVFVFMPSGSARSLENLQILAQSMRLAQLEMGIAAALSGTSAGQPDARSLLSGALQRIEPWLAEFRIPTVVVGFRAEHLRSMIEPEIAELITDLPANITRSKWTPIEGGTPIDRLTASGSAMMTTEVEAQIRQGLEPELGEALASRLVEFIKAQQLEFAAGFDGDYLLLAFGHSVGAGQFTPDPTASLAASDRLERIGKIAGDNTHALSFASSDLTRLAVPEIALAALFEIVRPHLVQLLPAEELEQLSVQLAKLDERAKAFLPQKSSDATSIFNWGRQLMVKSYGGVAPAFCAQTGLHAIHPQQFEDAVFFWARVTDRESIVAVFDWTADLAKLAYSTFAQFILPQLPPADVVQFKAVEGVFLPKLFEAYSLAREFSVEIVGSESAFVLDFKGSLAEIEAVPPPFRDLPGAPRLALVWSLAEAPRLLPWASRVMKLANELASFAQPDAGIPLPLPSLVPRETPDGTHYLAPLPVDLGELHPSAFVTKSGYLAIVTSPGMVSKLSPAQPSPGQPAIRLQLQLEPLFEALAGWLQFVSKHKDQTFPNAPEEAAKYEQALPDTLKLLGTLEKINGVQFESSHEEGIWTSTFRVGPNSSD